MSISFAQEMGRGSISIQSSTNRDGDKIFSEYAPVNLIASINQEGNVILTWQPPTGFIPIAYRIYRTMSAPLFDSIAIIKNPNTTFYIDYTAQAGTFYSYAVQAVYTTSQDGNTAYTEINFQPKPNDISFITQPLITALVDQTYDYDFNIKANAPDRVRFYLTGSYPDSMVINSIDSRLYWVPRRRGLYSITLIAEDTLTQARAAQEFSIRVADHPATVSGNVKDELGNPVENATVRITQIGNGTSFTYEVTTSSEGEFSLANVQGGVFGNVSKIYTYVKSPLPELSSQWFINASKLNAADEKILLTGESLRINVTLHPNPNNLGLLTGIVRDTLGDPIIQAKVSFIPISNFIHIGDTTNRNNPYLFSLHNGMHSFAEKSVYTDGDGSFSVSLPMEKYYYALCEREGFVAKYHPNEANALEARPVRIAQNSVIKISLAPIPTGNGVLTGKVFKSDNNLSTNSLIVLIRTPISRGAGGHNEFQSGRTDSNGVFIFKNLPDSSKYVVLSLPIGEAAPLYYSPGGGTTDWQNSSEVQVSGTVQDVNIGLSPTVNKGIGSIWGQVTTISGILTFPVSGSLVYAITANTNEIAGYAITDSTGYYSISGLPPNIYTITANKLGSERTIELNNQMLNYTDSKSLERIREVNISIPSKTVSVNEVIDPNSFALFQNYPNPFSAGSFGNPSTEISYYVPKYSRVSLKVINLIGQEVATLVDGATDAGTHRVTFNALNIPSGMYFYQLRANGTFLTRKMVVVK